MTYPRSQCNRVLAGELQALLEFLQCGGASKLHLRGGVWREVLGVKGLRGSSPNYSNQSNLASLFSLNNGLQKRFYLNKDF